MNVPSIHSHNLKPYSVQYLDCSQTTWRTSHKIQPFLLRSHPTQCLLHFSQLPFLSAYLCFLVLPYLFWNNLTIIHSFSVLLTVAQCLLLYCSLFMVLTIILTDFLSVINTKIIQCISITILSLLESYSSGVIKIAPAKHRVRSVLELEEIFWLQPFILKASHNILDLTKIIPLLPLRKTKTRTPYPNILSIKLGWFPDFY